jgi:hypothetical protein
VMWVGPRGTEDRPMASAAVETWFAQDEAAVVAPLETD